MDLRQMFPFSRREPPSRLNGGGLALMGFAIGAASAALLEPRGGARRRGMVTQKAGHAGRAARTFGGKAARDLANRSRGMLASARSSVRESSVPEEVLCERVRSRLGRLTANSSAIEVSARGGAVELHGPVLEAEARGILRGVRRVRGVHEVVDRLERHARPGRVPALQGGGARPGPRPALMQLSWSPGVRLLALVLGVGLATPGLRARGPWRLALPALGALLALRGATNLPLRRLLGIGAPRGAAGDRRASSDVDAPLEERGVAPTITPEDLRPS